jgi:hypothetical protein
MQRSTISKCRNLSFVHAVSVEGTFNKRISLSMVGNLTTYRSCTVAENSMCKKASLNQENSLYGAILIPCFATPMTWRKEIVIGTLLILNRYFVLGILWG